MSKKRAYDVPDGAAEETLRIAAEQGHIELVFASEVIVGYETSAIKGRYAIADALNLMLEGTPLVAVPVSDAQAFGIIKRVKKGGKVSERSENQLQKTSIKKLKEKSEMNLPMNEKKKNNRRPI